MLLHWTPELSMVTSTSMRLSPEPSRSRRTSCVSSWWTPSCWVVGGPAASDLLDLVSRVWSASQWYCLVSISVVCIHDFTVWNIPPPSRVVLHVKMQKNYKIFSQLSATLIVQLKMCWVGPPSCCDCCWSVKSSSVVVQARHFDLTYYTLTRHCYYF